MGTSERSTDANAKPSIFSYREVGFRLMPNTLFPEPKYYLTRVSPMPKLTTVIRIILGSGP